MLRLFLVVLSVTACHDNGSEGTPIAHTNRDRPEKPKLPPLSGARALPLLPSTKAPPAAYASAIARWETATTAYERGEAEAAARAFLSAADALDTEEPEALARTFAAGRCLAYENAARAFSAGRAFARGKDVLEEKRKADPACRHSITAALERVHRAHLAAGGTILFRPL